MTQKEIEAADILIKGATSHGVLYTSLFHPDEEKEAFRPITNVAVKYLKEEGLLEVFQHHESSFLYRLTAKGLDLQRSGKNYSDYLEEQKQKAERDNLHKDLQIQKLEAEMLVLKDMQAEQRTFWQSGIDRDNRQRWQFWLTLLLAGGGFLLGIINFVKSMII